MRMCVVFFFRCFSIILVVEYLWCIARKVFPGNSLTGAQSNIAWTLDESCFLSFLFRHREWKFNTV